ncbi:MAG: YicC family protein [Bacteroidales bacterium]|nr:YicC family protein [Bacteroidales bacterium]
MIKSMTGYGRADGEVNNTKFTVEVKTLNSKQFDMVSRIPYVYKEKELQIRSLLQQKLERGKIEITVAVEESKAEVNYTLNRELAKKYYLEIIELQQELGVESNPLLFSSILKLPEVIQSIPEKLEEEEWEGMQKIVQEALSLCDVSRINEGKVLENDFVERIASIASLLSEVEKYEDQRIRRIRDKIKADLDKYFNETKIDENRLEQEIVYYIEKIDITEEKVRLKNHCNYFIQTLAEDETSNGKKLNFISQEIGREINTIGSKANDSDIQKLVVQMKDELEKIKEQLFNIL